MGKEIPNRKSIRLPGYDYSGSGGYYVTMCTQGRRHFFGCVVRENDSVGANPCVRPDYPNIYVQLSAAGEMVKKWWNKIPDKFPGMHCDEMIVMPNHVHFIVINTMGKAQGEHAGNTGLAKKSPTPGGHMGPPVQVGREGHSLSTVVQWFKTMPTNEYIHGVKQHGWLRFDNRLWQRNYWERIVRENEWDRIREYIRDNPVNWAQDRLNE
ncbi:MAG: hypothetical protein K9M45_00205 [Kiritimatiellales bacterium]|nr:hypothetical protein [Kiritimatiellales bacterium]